MQKKTLIVIVGPTAIGKTALAIQMANHYQTEIISADARQFFRETNIGTAKPTTAELSTVKHHFINSHSIHDYFSNGDFEIEALKLINHLFEKKNTLIMVGGSGLYIDALCNGLDALPKIDLNIREELNQQFKTQGIEVLKTQLKDADPEYFEKVDKSNPQRIIRGLEMFLSTGTKLSSYLTKTKKNRSFDIVKIGLNTDRSLLYQQINQRVDKMITDGLLEEVKKLYPFKHLNALKTVGYTELFDYLDNNTTLELAIEKIKQNTRRFAKRQITWFKRDTEIQWFEPNQYASILQYLEQTLNNS